jgi:hypothetical protein
VAGGVRGILGCGGTLRRGSPATREAAWWSAHPTASLEAFGRAFGAFEAEANPRAVARVALRLALEQADRGETAVWHAWLQLRETASSKAIPTRYSSRNHRDHAQCLWPLDRSRSVPGLVMLHFRDDRARRRGTSPQPGAGQGFRAAWRNEWDRILSLKIITEPRIVEVVTACGLWLVTIEILLVAREVVSFAAAAS